MGFGAASDNDDDEWKGGGMKKYIYKGWNLYCVNRNHKIKHIVFLN